MEKIVRLKWQAKHRKIQEFRIFKTYEIFKSTNFQVKKNLSELNRIKINKIIKQ